MAAPDSCLTFEQIVISLTFVFLKREMTPTVDAGVIF